VHTRSSKETLLVSFEGHRGFTRVVILGHVFNVDNCTCKSTNWSNCVPKKKSPELPHHYLNPCKATYCLEFGTYIAREGLRSDGHGVISSTAN
jgi:hypothetical protein